MTTLPDDALVGVDLVPLSRIRMVDERGEGSLFRRRLLGAEEQAWCAAHEDPVLAVAACLATKEAAVKLFGGRPDGFRWTDVELGPPADPAPEAAVAVCEALEGAGVTGVELHHCPQRTSAAVPRDGGGGRAGLWAAWGRLDEDVIAVTMWS